MFVERVVALERVQRLVWRRAGSAEQDAAAGARAQRGSLCWAS